MGWSSFALWGFFFSGFIPDGCWVGWLYGMVMNEHGSVVSCVNFAYWIFSMLHSEIRDGSRSTVRNKHENKTRTEAKGHGDGWREGDGWNTEKDRFGEC